MPCYQICYQKILVKSPWLLRAKRNALGISQEELAFRSGLHRTYVGSVERGERNLSLENIFVFAKALACNPIELIPNNSINY